MKVENIMEQLKLRRPGVYEINGFQITLDATNCFSIQNRNGVTIDVHKTLDDATQAAITEFGELEQTLSPWST